MPDTNHSNGQHAGEAAPAPENSQPDIQAPFSPSAQPDATPIRREAAYPPPDARARVEPSWLPEVEAQVCAQQKPPADRSAQQQQARAQQQPQAQSQADTQELPQVQTQAQSSNAKPTLEEPQLPFAHAPLTYISTAEHNPAPAPAAQPQSPLQDPQELAALNRARSCATVGIVCGIMSLFVGGVLLSALAIIFSFVSYRTSARYIKDKNSVATPAWQEQRLRTRLALIISICAFVLSVLALIFLYPVMLEFLQANGFDSLPFGSESSGSESAGGSGGSGDSGGSGGGSSGSSVWG